MAAPKATGRIKPDRRATASTSSAAPRSRPAARLGYRKTPNSTNAMPTRSGCRTFMRPDHAKTTPRSAAMTPMASPPRSQPLDFAVQSATRPNPPISGSHRDQSGVASTCRRVAPSRCGDENAPDERVCRKPMTSIPEGMDDRVGIHHDRAPRRLDEAGRRGRDSALNKPVPQLDRVSPTSAKFYDDGFAQAKVREACWAVTVYSRVARDENTFGAAVRLNDDLPTLNLSKSSSEIRRAARACLTRGRARLR